MAKRATTTEPASPTPMPTSDMRAERPDVEDTRAIRLKLTKLQADYKCPECGTPWPNVRSTVGRVRHIRCRHCGRTGKLVLDA